MLGIGWLSTRARDHQKCKAKSATQEVIIIIVYIIIYIYININIILLLLLFICVLYVQTYQKQFLCDSVHLFRFVLPDYVTIKEGYVLNEGEVSDTENVLLLSNERIAVPEVCVTFLYYSILFFFLFFSFFFVWIVSFFCHAVVIITQGVLCLVSILYL